MVTGAAGFLGSHLCEALLRRGHEVIGIDDLSSGRRANLATFVRLPTFSFREADVNDGIPVRGPVDGVFHLISPTPAVAVPCDGAGLPPVPTGVDEVIEFAGRRRCRLLLVGATGEEYDDPFAEDAHLMTRRRRGAGPDLRVARLFSAYGPRMEPEDEPTLAHLTLQGVTGQPLSLAGQPDDTRTFCFVSDLVNGMLRLFRSELGAHPVDLGDPTAHSLGGDRRGRSERHRVAWSRSSSAGAAAQRRRRGRPPTSPSRPSSSGGRLGCRSARASRRPCDGCTTSWVRPSGTTATPSAGAPDLLTAALGTIGVCTTSPAIEATTTP